MGDSNQRLTEDHFQVCILHCPIPSSKACHRCDQRAEKKRLAHETARSRSIQLLEQKAFDSTDKWFAKSKPCYLEPSADSMHNSHLWVLRRQDLFSLAIICVNAWWRLCLSCKYYRISLLPSLIVVPSRTIVDLVPVHTPSRSSVDVKVAALDCTCNSAGLLVIQVL